MKKLSIISVVFLSFLSATLMTFHKSWADGTLVAYWKLDETTAGSTAVDSSGNGYDGTPTNNPSPSTDIPSTITFTDPRSLHFSGTQSISIPDDPAFAMTSATFSVWVKFDNTPGDMNMIAKRSSNPGGTQVQWQFGYSSGSNSFKVTLANGGNTCCTDFNWSPSPSISTNTWYNITISINGTTNKLRWYQDGVFKEEDDITGTNLGTQISAPLSLGASYAGTGERLIGYLDDVRIYNTVLSDQEIAAIADGEEGPGVPTPTPTPTPTSTPNISSSNSHNGTPPHSSSQTCTSAMPTGTADLFQIDTSQTQATLFFAPASGDVTNYAIAYGYTSGDERFSTFTNQGKSTGVLSYTINELSPNLTYHFKVRPYNGCMSGNWSNEMKITTTKNNNTTVKFYKNFLSQVKSLFPQSSTVLSATTNKSQQPTCQNYTVLRGDSLWKIAKKHFGDGTKYPQIQSTNNLTSTLLPIGQKLKIGC